MKDGGFNISFVIIFFSFSIAAMRAGRPSAKRMNGVTILKMILTTHEDHLNQKRMAYIPTIIQKRKFMMKKGIKANFITKLIFTGGSHINSSLYLRQALTLRIAKTAITTRRPPQIDKKIG